MTNIRRTIAIAVVAMLMTACNGGGGAADEDIDFAQINPLPEKRLLLPSIAQADNTFNSVHHAGSGVCSECHNDDEMVVPTDSGVDKNVSIGMAWRTSVMANGTRDPYWHAVVAWELDEFPMLEDTINDKCTVCHAPMAHDYAQKEGLTLRLFDDVETGEPGIYFWDRPARDATAEDGSELVRTEEEQIGDTLFDHAMDGISCSLCHQMDGGNFGTEQSFTGGYEILDARDLDNRPAYGQYPNPDAAYMNAQTARPAQGIPGFLAQQSAHISTSETCAVCHNLNIQPVDTAGVPLEDGVHFAEQANYTEWLLSDYRTGGPLEASCQDCHMPKLDTPVIMASGSGSVPREDFAEHTFLGANTVMQTMFRDFSEELGIPADITAADFDESIERNREFLRTSANVEITNLERTLLETPVSEAEPNTEGEAESGAEGDPEPGTEGDAETEQTAEGEEAAAVEPVEAMEQLSFDVVIENKAGHKLPTGYHSRRVYLHVIVTSDEGIVWQSGKIDEAGRIAGLSEDTNSHSWELHYDVITDPSQVQVYQAVVGNSDGDRTASLVNGNHYLKDNRILPKGYDKAAVANGNDQLPSFGTFGAALDDNDFDGGSDTVTYRPRVPAGRDYQVLVELRYQPMAYGHLQELFLKSDRLDVMDMFRTIYDATELRDEVIGTDTVRFDAE